LIRTRCSNKRTWSLRRKLQSDCKYID
jgi:hypothetical protein